MDRELEYIMRKRREEAEARIMANWTEAELEILKANYADKTLAQLMELLPGKTQAKIADTAKRLGLKRTEWHGPQQVRKWSAREIAYLERTYGEIPVEEIAEALPGRTPAAVRIRAQKRGLNLKKKNAGRNP